MPEASAENVQDKLRAAIEAQERVKQAARDEAAKGKDQAPQPEQAPQEGQR